MKEKDYSSMFCGALIVLGVLALIVAAFIFDLIVGFVALGTGLLFLGWAGAPGNDE